MHVLLTSKVICDNPGCVTEYQLSQRLGTSMMYSIIQVNVLADIFPLNKVCV